LRAVVVFIVKWRFGFIESGRIIAGDRSLGRIIALPRFQPAIHCRRSEPSAFGFGIRYGGAAPMAD
jgi:hypothetical protein